jgi:hypothetical protein
MFFRDPATALADEVGVAASEDEAEVVADGSDLGATDGVVTSGSDPATDGGDDAPSTDRVTFGMHAVVVVTAVLAVALGLAVFEYAEFLEPTITRLLTP